MIRSIRHKGLRRLFEEGDARGVFAAHSVKLLDILSRLHAARSIDDLDIAGFRLHALKGPMVGFWAATVRANWRVVFRFKDGDASDVDYVDYH